MVRTRRATVELKPDSFIGGPIPFRGTEFVSTCSDVSTMTGVYVHAEFGNSHWDRSHTREGISPYLRHDLRKAKSASFNSWAEAVFGLDEGGLESWIKKLQDLRLFNESTVQQCLAKYCATEEIGRAHV